MIRLVLIGFFLLQSLALAQVPEKWFVVALARSDGYAIANNEAQNAKIRLQRLKTDPLATKPLLLEASTTLESAEARLMAARLEVRRGLFQDVFAWSGASDTLNLTQAKLALADASAKAAQARYKTGAITSVDLNRAEAELRSAQNDFSSAQAELSGATEVLRSRLGFAPDQNANIEATPRLSKQVLDRNLENAVRIVEAKGALARAKLDLEIKDNEFSAAIEISEAKRVVGQAERSLADARNSIRNALTSRWEVYQSAIGVMAARDRAVLLAKDELKTQSERLARGLVSQVVVMQAKVNLAQQIATLEQSRQRFALSVLDLGILVNLDLWQRV